MEEKNKTPQSQEPNVEQPNAQSPETDELSQFELGIKGDVPQSPNVDVPKSDVPSEDIISSANQKASEPIFDAKIKLTNLYIQCEQKRLEQQKPLLDSIISVTKILIWLFNIVICVITCTVVAICFVQHDITALDKLFEFLKYYIGVVLVEMLGMLLFIAKSVFSSNYKKILEKVLNQETKNEKAK